jgi:hypothetical protein
LPNLVIGIAAVGSAVTAIAHWPVELLLGCIPIAATAITARATRTTSWRRPAIVGVLSSVAVGFGVAVHAVLAGGASVKPRPTPPVAPAAKAEWVTATTRLPVRDVAAGEEGTLWALAGPRDLLELDASSLNTLGVALQLPARTEDVISCAGQVLVTYGGGMIAEVGDHGPRLARRLRYGRPVPADSRRAGVTCGGGSVFVSMPLEARVVRIAVPALRVVARIAVGEFVSAVAYAGGPLYAADSTQAAVLTVNLTTNIATHWTTTTSQLGLVVGLGSEAALLMHTDSSCIGLVRPGKAREVAATWSTRAAVQAAATGGGIGVVVDRSGRLYRFDPETGNAIATAIHVPDAEHAASITVAAGGVVAIAVPSRRLLISVRRSAWGSAPRASGASPGCLG